MENMADNAALEAEGIATPEEPAEESTSPAGADNAGNVDLTKAMTERINKVREETEARVRAELKAQHDAEVAKRWGHKSWDDLIAEDDKVRQQQQQDQFMAAGIDPSLIEQVVEQRIQSDPSIKQAQQVALQYQIEQSQRKADEQIRLISEIDPSIKSYEDLLSMPNYNEWRGLIMDKGYSFVDAFKLTNFNTLLNGKSAAGRQAALNQLGGKQHLRSSQVGSGTPDEIEVPEDVMTYYRRLNKGVTDEEIKKHYAKSIRSKGE